MGINSLVDMSSANGGRCREGNLHNDLRVQNYVCEVQLPEPRPIRFAVRHMASKKSIAKRSAAFQACLLLRRGGHLDGNFIATHHERLPSIRNAQLALSMN